MEIIHDEILLWEDIKNQYPNEWVVVLLWQGSDAYFHDKIGFSEY